MNTKNIVIGLLALLIVALGVYMFVKQSSETEVVVIDENADMIPVEPDGGIGDGAPDLGDVLAEERGSETVIGKSVQGTNITAYHFGSGDTEVLVIGGVHGSDAPSTVALTKDLISYYTDNESEVPAAVTLTIIENLNPDGFAMSGEAGRFNANKVDLNRNFDCEWSAEAVWKNQKVSGGSAAFSEPEAAALRNYVETYDPNAAIVYFASEGKVYPSACNGTPSNASVELAATFANAAAYAVEAEFDAYAITGDMVNWMAKQGIPSISVLLSDRQNSETVKNRAGLRAVLNQYAN